MADYIIEITESTVSAEETGFRMFGIRVLTAGGTELQFPSLSTNADSVAELAEKLRRHNVSQKHIADIIEDEFFFGEK